MTDIGILDVHKPASFVMQCECGALMSNSGGAVCRLTVDGHPRNVTGPQLTCSKCGHSVTLLEIPGLRDDG